ncbi:MAG: MFS transporter [Actinobacteria bacterium]|nr:MFS transporter [Actinomycetota bacterium]
MVYAPNMLFSFGEGAVMPLIPVLATQLGADVTLAALVSGALVIGELCGNLPAGWAVARFGERRTMIVAAAVAIVAVLGLLFSPTLPLFALSVLLLGFCGAAFTIARHAFMTTRVDPAFRARALSLLGGTARGGIFLGPFVAAALIGVFHHEHVVPWFYVACLVAVLLLVALGPDPEQRTPRFIPLNTQGIPVPIPEPLPRQRPGVFATMVQHRGVLMRVGMAAAALSAVRSARQALLPLWGVSLHLDAQTISVIVGISGALDFALFYLSGQIMDRFGRLWAVIPALAIMSAGFIALAFTHDLPQATVWLAVLGAVLGLGNGLSSGILMTIGADLAPQASPAAFLGSWRTLGDAGGALAPLLISGITAVASLAAASGAIGAIGVLGAFAFARWLPRHLPRRPRP